MAIYKAINLGWAANTQESIVGYLYFFVSRIDAPVAQLDRVPGYELGGRRFESFRARHT